MVIVVVIISMPIVTVTHQNPGMVTKKIDMWANIQSQNLVVKTVNDKLDDLYQVIFKAMPVRTGYMRSTLALQTGDGFSQLVVTARYARFVERGTRNMAAQPFFFPNTVRMTAELIVAVRMLFMTVR